MSNTKVPPRSDVEAVTHSLIDVVRSLDQLHSTLGGLALQRDLEEAIEDESIDPRLRQLLASLLEGMVALEKGREASNDAYSKLRHHVLYAPHDLWEMVR